MMKVFNLDIDKLFGFGGVGGGCGRKVGVDDDDMGFDKGEDEDEEFGGKKRLNLNKIVKGGDDDGEDVVNDIDMDEEELE